VLRRIVILSLVMGAAVGVRSAAAQMPSIPPGYTAYQIEAPGVGAPPLPLKFEGDRLVTTEEIAPFFSIPESHVTSDRIEATFIFEGTDRVRLRAVRHGDAFAGIIYGRDEEGAGFGLPVVFRPLESEVEIEPDLTVFASAPGISRVEILAPEGSLKAGEAILVVSSPSVSESRSAMLIRRS